MVAGVEGLCAVMERDGSHKDRRLPFLAQSRPDVPLEGVKRSSGRLNDSRASLSKDHPKQDRVNKVDNGKAEDLPADVPEEEVTANEQEHHSFAGSAKDGEQAISGKIHREQPVRYPEGAHKHADNVDQECQIGRDWRYSEIRLHWREQKEQTSAYGEIEDRPTEKYGSR